LGSFKLLCSRCGTDNVIVKSGEKRFDKVKGGFIYGKGVQRKCTQCSNEDFVIFETWVQKDQKEV